MDLSLNNTFKAMKESVNTVRLKQQDQLRNLVLRAKCSNFTESVVSAAGDKTAAISSSRLSDFRLNNYPQTFKEDVEPRKSLKEFKTIFTSKTIEDEPSSSRFKPKMQKVINNDSDENDTDPATPCSRRSSIQKYKNSIFEKARQSQTILLDSFKQDSLDDEFMNYPKISSSLCEELNSTMDTLRPYSKKNMNFIIFMGFLAGLLVSKFLQIIQLLLNWLLQQILHLNNNVLGTISMKEFLNFNHTNRLQLRSKLLLLPVTFVYSLIYSFIYVLHFVIQYLLSNAPSSLIKFVQKLDE